MSWLTTTDLAAYDNAAGPFLSSRPTEHTVLLTVAERVRRVRLSAAGVRLVDGGGGAGGAAVNSPSR